MRILCAMFSLVVALLSPVIVVNAAAQSTPGIPPSLIPVSGELKTSTGEPRTGAVVLAISLYDEKDDPAPRWIEYQTVALDANGTYDVQFGATQPDGLPADLFTNATGVRWLGVAVENEVEQPRMMLVSVPYAAKALTAETLAGKTANDFVLATNLTDEVKAVLRERSAFADGDNPDLQGVQNYLQKDNGTGGLADSNVREVNGNVGIGIASPITRLDVDGDSQLRGAVTIGKATFPSDAGLFTYNSENFFITSLSNRVLNLGANYAFDRLVITPAGNIGIGTRNPNEELHIAGPDNVRLMITRNGASHVLLGDISGQNDAALILYDAAGNSDVLIRADGKTVFNGGNVGIGTTSPVEKLHVVGNMRVDGTITSQNQDVAEWVDSAEPLEPGMIVVIDDTATNRVMAATREYDSRVAGAVSAQPGVALGTPREGSVLVAQSGRVRVKADATKDAIRPGDLLVSSSKKGHAMRSCPVKIRNQCVHRPGTLIGKALESLERGQGEILVLLTLQ